MATTETRDLAAPFVGERAIAPPRRNPLAGRAVIYLLILFGAALVLIPFAWMLSTSLTLTSRLFVYPPDLIPSPVAWDNYVTAWTALPVSFTRFAFNTLFITLLAMVAEIASASIVAYGFARYAFPGRDFLFVVLLGSMMLPGVVLQVPSFLIWRQLGLLDTYDPLTVGAWFAWGPSYVFLLRQFFLTIPVDIDEAARIDGATAFQIYYRIMLPLVKPALLAIGVLSLVGNWNNFSGALIYLNHLEKFPIVLALKFFERTLSNNVPPFNFMMAMATVMTIPMLALYFVAQRYFIEGITVGGVKG
jgi:multiple sugar transport system permease protein